MNNTKHLFRCNNLSTFLLLLVTLILLCGTTAWSFNPGQPAHLISNSVSIQAGGQPVFTSNCEKLTICNLDLNCRPVPITVSLENSVADNQLSVSYRIDFDADGIFDLERPANSSIHELPVGQHRIEWNARHQNGKSSTCLQMVEVTDCRVPVPHAINGKSLLLKADEKSILLHTSDIDQFSVDNCAITELRIFSPSRGPGQQHPPKYKGQTVEFTREHLGTNSIDLWVKDEAGNWSYTTTHVYLSEEKVENKAKDVESIYMDLMGSDKRSLSMNQLKEKRKSKLVLFQNEPNPFDQSTSIRFYLPQANVVTFELIDPAGRTIKSKRAHYNAGLHTIQLDAKDLLSHDLLIYRLSTPEDVATKKMLRKGA